MHSFNTFSKKQLLALHILSGIIPVLVMGTMFAISRVFPFGTRQILVTDLWQQYYPFISEYWHRIREGGSLRWSWTAAGGHDYVAHIAYYMASPFNLLAALFPHAWLREMLTLFLLFKLGFAGFFMSLYMRFALKKVDILTPVFSTFYALCAFTMGYYWNIMWIDTIAMMPLVILGVHYIVSEGKYFLFVITLALAIIFNFYIGIFVCIFVALTFFAKSIYLKLDLITFIKRFGVIAVAAGLALGMSAFITLPTYSALQLSYRSSSNFPEFRFITSFVNVIGNFIPFTPATNLSGLPNLYSGLISLMLIPVFLMIGKISIKEKIAYMVLLVFLVLSVNINTLDFIWNAFTLTNMLPFRFSFVASFIVATMAYRTYVTMERVRIRDLIGMVLSAAFFITMAFLGEQENIHAAMTIGFAALYLAAFITVHVIQKKYLPKIAKPKPAKTNEENAEENTEEATLEEAVIEPEEPTVTNEQITPQAYPIYFILLSVLKIVLFVVIMAEVSITAHNSVMAVRNTDRTSYPLQYDQIQTLLSYREPAEVDFFRTDLSRWWTTNDPSLYGYEGWSFFSSLANVHVSNFFANIGLHAWARSNSFRYAETSPLTNAFINMRYMISRDGHPAADNGIFWDTVGTYGNAHISRNNRALPLGFMTRPELQNFVGQEHNPFYSQNELFRLSTGLDGDLFTLIDVVHVGHTNYFVSRYGLGEYRFTLNEGYTSGSFRYNFLLEEDALLYGFIRMPAVYDWRVTVDRQTQHTVELRRPYIFFAGEFEAGVQVSFEANSETETGRGQLFAATLNRELFEQGMSILGSQVLELTHFSDTRVEGVITVAEPGLLYTSIPHSNNWRAFVNGQRQEIICIGNAMAAVMLDTGTHEISFRFHNRALNFGLALAFISAIIFGAMVFLARKGYCVFEIVYGKIFASEKTTQAVKYLFFGGTTTLVNWVTFSVLVAIVGINMLISNIFAWLVAVAFAFMVNKIYVFQNSSRNIKDIINQMGMFLGVRIASGLIEIMGLPLLYMIGLNQTILGVDGFAAKIVISIIVVIINYLLSRTFVFRERAKETPEATEE